MSKPIRIIVHTTADASPEPQFRKVNEYHKQQEFPKSSLGYFCGYTYFVERDGTLIQARKDDEEQAHTRGMNQDSIGIGMALDGDKERPTIQQWKVLKELLNAKMVEHNILPNNISGHRNFTTLKTCPGLKISDLEIKQLFTPDISYLEKQLTRLKELLKQLSSRTGKVKGQKELYN